MIARQTTDTIKRRAVFVARRNEHLHVENIQRAIVDAHLAVAKTLRDLGLCACQRRVLALEAKLHELKLEVNDLHRDAYQAQADAENAILERGEEVPA